MNEWMGAMLHGTSEYGELYPLLLTFCWTNEPFSSDNIYTFYNMWNKLQFDTNTALQQCNHYSHPIAVSGLVQKLQHYQ